LEFCCELNSNWRAAEIILDVSAVQWAFPYGALVIASQVRRLRDEFNIAFSLCGYDPDRNAHSYLAHIGFFKLLGFEIGKAPGEAAGSATYLPFTILDYNDLMIDEILSENPMHVAIQRKAEEFAGLLSQSHKLTVLRPVTYCIRELIRNVFEHSHCNECILGGQAYKDGRVLVGIVDHGRGLRASLSEKYVVPNDIEALKLAIKPGISRSKIDESDENPWSNSGFGLYVLSELGRITKYFSIASGDSLLHLSPMAVGCKGVCHNGTAVNIIFEKPHGTNLEHVINDIIAKGERLAKQSGLPVRASKSSRTI
jgi:hypothetical protein